MKPPVLGLVTILSAAAGMAGCGPWREDAGGRSPGREPVRWIMVEKEARDLAREGLLEEGQVEPGARMLVLEPVFPEVWQVTVQPRDYYVELLDVSPSGAVTPGEIVTARLRVGKAKPRSSYRITAKPSNAGVTIVGDTEQQVLGSAHVEFRFTSIHGGRGGISVGAECMPE